MSALIRQALIIFLMIPLLLVTMPMPKALPLEIMLTITLATVAGMFLIAFLKLRRVSRDQSAIVRT
jgi:hypothetical protein